MTNRAERRKKRREEKLRLLLCSKDGCREPGVGSLCQKHHKAQRAATDRWAAKQPPKEPRERCGPKLRMIEFRGVIRSKQGWAEHLKISMSSLKWRMLYWSSEDAFTTIGPRPREQRVRHGGSLDGVTREKEQTEPGCPRCHLHGEHVCTPPAAYYAQFRKDGGDAAVVLKRA